MAAFGVNYNPSAVMMRPPGVAGQPYLGTGRPPANNVAPGTTARPGPPASAGGTLGATSIRPTSNAGYDPAYAQNLATYAGGQFSGVTSFNPFNLSTFPGAPTGGGNAPVAGLPNTLLSQAQGGQAFSWNPPAQQTQQDTAAPGTSTVLNMRDWLNQFLSGRLLGAAGT